MKVADKPLYPKDIMDCTQRTLRRCQMIFAIIRKQLGKGKSYTVTVQDFANYKQVSVEYLLRVMGVDEDLVKKK